MKPLFTVCGAGRAGTAIAADITLMGYDVNLFELSGLEESVKPIIKAGGIELSGKTQSGKVGFAKIKKITTDPREAIKDADLIMVAPPAFAHKAFFEAFAPYLKKGQCVVVNTGYWASLRLAGLLKKFGIFDDITLAEANIMPYLSDKQGNKSHIFNVKQDIKLATFPGKKETLLFDVMKLVYPQHVKVPNVLWTNFAAGNPSAHATLLLPIAGIPFDRYRGCKLYGEATVPGARLVDAFDMERIKVAKALGCDAETAFEHIQRTYSYTGKDIAEAYRKSPHADRYIPAERIQAVILEDLSYFYVPVSRIADSLSIDTPIIDGIVNIMGAMLDTNYWEKGITLEQLGLSGKSAEEIVTYVNDGSTGHIPQGVRERS